MADVVVSGGKSAQYVASTSPAAAAPESVTVKSFNIPGPSGARFKAISDAIHQAGLAKKGDFAFVRGMRQEGGNFVALVHVGVFEENVYNDDPHYLVTVSSNNVASNIRDAKVVG